MSKPVALIKFFRTEEYRNQFLEGKIYCNTPQYYRNDRTAGVGDQSESCFKYYDFEYGDPLPEILVKNDTITKKLDLAKAINLTIFPSREPFDSWLHCWAIIEDDGSIEDELERLSIEFGCYFVILPYSNFPRYIKQLNDNIALSIESKKVSYSSDLTKLDLSTKHSKYSYQREYRFLFGQCNKSCTTHNKFYVGSLRHIIHSGDSLKIEYPNGKITYFSKNNVLSIPPKETTI